MRRLAASTHFQRPLRRLSPLDQANATSALKRLLAALTSQQLAVGAGFKKINGDKYELRVGLRLRIVMKLEGDTLVCHLIGGHDEMRRYLRQSRDR